MVLQGSAEECERGGLGVQAFFALGREGCVVHLPPGSSIGAKRNAGARAVGADFIASFDDDDFSLPSRISTQLVSLHSPPAKYNHSPHLPTHPTKWALRPRIAPAPPVGSIASPHSLQPTN